MNQKIVITASVNKSTDATTPEVTYQWHWRRILTAGLLISFVVIVLIYGLMGSVNAEQNGAIANTEQARNEAITAGKEPTLVVSEPQATEQVDSVSTQAANEQREKPSIAAKSIKPAITAKNQPVPLNDEASSTRTVTVSDDELTDAAQNDDADQSGHFEQSNFSETAHVASVALGAKIDTDKVSRAVLTRDVVDHEPINVFKPDIRLNQFNDTLVFFSELKNLQGQQVKHIWRYENKIMASIVLDVTASRYRTYSNKHILPEQTGHWRVDVVDAQDRLLAQKEFRILAN